MTNGSGLALGSGVLMRRHHLWLHLHVPDQHLGYSLMSTTDSCLTAEHRQHLLKGFQKWRSPQRNQELWIFIHPELFSSTNILLEMGENTSVL